MQPMTDTGSHIVVLTKVYSADRSTLFNLFRDGTVFKLTGADNIQSVFETGGPFRLTFHNRGVIAGRFIEITDAGITLEWNVDGFKMRPQTETIVEISLVDDAGKCTLTLVHKNIVHEPSAVVKRKAWAEILDDIERELQDKR